MVERVILVGLARGQNNRRSALMSLEETARLVETAGGVVQGQTIQNAARLDPATLVGSGKAREIGRMVSEQKISTVIFDEDLTPAQQRNLETAVGAKVIDRTRLILDIFARRARTREGILQVELAQLTYLLPRLSGQGTSLMQQVGGIGTRGPGERKLEISQRRIRDKMARLRGQIESIRHQRSLQRKRRQKISLPVVALTGYTNVGKSTLLNALTSADNGGIYADDKLFATLDPTTRRVSLPNGTPALFTDTVGFINKLPTSLIASFRATLEEIQKADCLIHVVDASHPHWKEQVNTVEKVLREMNAPVIPQILVFNKCDLVDSVHQQNLGQWGIVISSRTKFGLQKLLQAVQDNFSRRLITKQMTLPHHKAHLLHSLHETGQILRKRYGRQGVHVTAQLDEGTWRKILKEVES